MVLGLFLIVVGLGCQYYSCFFAGRRGAILSKGLWFASEEERTRLTHDKQNRILSRILNGLWLALSLFGLASVTKLKLLGYIGIAILVVAVIYAIADGVAGHN